MVFEVVFKSWPECATFHWWLSHQYPTFNVFRMIVLIMRILLLCIDPMACPFETSTIVDAAAFKETHLGSWLLDFGYLKIVCDAAWITADSVVFLDPN